jgi:hypothetical protein
MFNSRHAVASADERLIEQYRAGRSILAGRAG